MKKRIYAVIVHYGPKEPTLRIVRVLCKTKGIIQGVIVVDHGGETLENTLPTDVHVIRRLNKGYFAGLKAGIAAVDARGCTPQDVVLCLNNDVMFSEEHVRSLALWIEQARGMWLAGAKMGNVNLVTGRAEITPASSATHLLQYVHGSVLAAPRVVFDKVPLPTGLEMYWEDVLFSIRAADAGIPLLQLPFKGEVHNDELKAPSPQKLYQLVRNGAAVLERAVPHPWRMYWRIVNMLRQAYHQAQGNADIARALRDRKSVEL